MSRHTVNVAVKAAVTFLAVALALGADLAHAGRKTRQFTFEDGTVGATTSTALNTITGPFTGVPVTVFGVPASYYDVGPGGIGGGTPLGTYVSTIYNPSPDFTSTFGLPKYVNVANGSPLDSPVPGSTVGIEFTGANNTVFSSQGFRGTFIFDAAVAANEPAADNVNYSTSFTVLTQGWVRPDPALSGTSQIVWSAGTEMGAPRITADGFWALTNLGPTASVISSRPVAFGSWTHVAVLRTGGSGSLYINGALAATSNGFFNFFAQEITLGADPLVAEPFTGVVDNFAVVGTAGFGIVISTDLDFFADSGIPTPSGVAGDVDQDGDADQADYVIWSNNAGFNNNFGLGDLTTLVKGDLDQNGAVNFFDFRIIARQAAANGTPLSLNVPEPVTAALAAIAAGVVVLVRRRRR
jgi:hypothetical protein